ncbi:serine/threonine-protein kinase [Luteolibacter sp. LG18]|uniref:serine/threonine protein kinase n=1 Tax=Luteolibacter sp. LG18 TaxID=2819286 RepID=UPI002B2937A6|nr:protein kinase [Luteolibacter sp. LG18]
MTSPIDRLMFVAVSGIASPEDRRAFLDFACHGDQALRELIEELLQIEGEAESFFEFEPAMTRVEVRTDGEQDGIGAWIGPYRLIDRLGAGGCGVVYLAEQEEPVRRKVALKIIRLGMDTESVIHRFAIEREALALMDHPNIARVLDAGTTFSGRPFFVMELVDGERITDYCDRKRLGLRERLELFVQVCEAIQHAHQKGVIHRDIKPSNVLVREHDGRPVPKVIDFGIAKATLGGTEGDATYTRSGQFLGTPAYMSPEQAEGSEDIDTRSDIYSLGAMLCELLAGRPPFAPEDFKNRGVDQIRTMLREQETGGPSTLLRSIAKEDMEKVAERRAVDPLRLPSQLAGDLDWIVMKATDKDRHRRYGTANWLAMDLQRYLRDEPVSARPPSRSYLLLKMVRRNRLLFAAGCVALSGLVAGLGASTYLFIRERNARTMAEQARANEQRMFQASEYADAVTQAAVFVRYRNMEEADRLLATIPPDQVPASLEAANTLIAVANGNLRKGNGKAAADRFHALVHVLAHVDMTDTEALSREWMPAAAAITEWGTPAQYEDLRRLAVRRFAGSTNASVAEHLLKSTLLEPVDPETLKALAPSAAVMEATLSGPKREKVENLVAWREFALALLAYRQDDLGKTEFWARASLKASGHEQRDGLDHILLAMVAYRQGRVDEAKETLKAVRADMTEWEKSPMTDATRHSWSNWGFGRPLLREAEHLVGMDVAAPEAK